jgi:hypothetical protein
MADDTSTGIDMQITPDYDSQIVGHHSVLLSFTTILISPFPMNFY